MNSESAIEAIGICSPGPLDPKNGVVINPPNLPCWRNFPLGENMRRLFAVPVSIDNDANAAALAEARWGSGRGYRNVFYAGLEPALELGLFSMERFIMAARGPLRRVGMWESISMGRYAVAANAAASR